VNSPHQKNEFTEKLTFLKLKGSKYVSLNAKRALEAILEARFSLLFYLLDFFSALKKMK